ncbi:hypothetical protein, partial [Pseudovibrio sp. Ad13]|uniref:hypothetical protein n=1 Tax=Pseudovibrio sp. Ad13 TaxID=989396 RepID=UPI0019D3FABA
SNSSILPAASDPKSRLVVRQNSKYGGDTSCRTLHLYSKIKVLRPPVETTALCQIPHDLSALHSFLEI